MDFKDYIRVIPDFPQPGISFKDITTLLKDGEMYRKAINELKVMVSDLKIDVIAGPEARGFVVGAPLAYALGVGLLRSVKAENCLERRSKSVMILNMARIRLLCIQMRSKKDKMF